MQILVQTLSFLLPKTANVKVVLQALLYGILYACSVFSVMISTLYSCGRLGHCHSFYSILWSISMNTHPHIYIIISSICKHKLKMSVQQLNVDKQTHYGDCHGHLLSVQSCTCKNNTKKKRRTRTKMNKEKGQRRFNLRSTYLPRGRDDQVCDERQECDEEGMGGVRMSEDEGDEKERSIISLCFQAHTHTHTFCRGAVLMQWAPGTPSCTHSSLTHGPDRSPCPTGHGPRHTHTQTHTRPHTHTVREHTHAHTHTYTVCVRTHTHNPETAFCLTHTTGCIPTPSSFQLH